jgi:hypothetical protein
MASTIAEAMLEEQVRKLEFEVTKLTTGMRNALTELQDGDVEGAIETLQQFVSE